MEHTADIHRFRHDHQIHVRTGRLRVLECFNQGSLLARSVAEFGLLHCEACRIQMVHHEQGQQILLGCSVFWVPPFPKKVVLQLLFSSPYVGHESDRSHPVKRSKTN